MESLWKSDNSIALNDIELRVYTSRLIGQEEDLVLWGGGNTSVKVKEKDHLGNEVEVLRIKGSGWDLKSIEAEGFAPCRLADLRSVMSRESMSDEKMVSFIQKSLLDPKAPRPSIETLLHAFLPHKYVDHTHADAILALTNNSNAVIIIKELYGDEIGVIAYIQPGFALSKQVALLYEMNPNLKGIILLNHGLLTFDDDAQKSYERTIKYVTMAEDYIGNMLAANPESLGSRRKQLLFEDSRIKKAKSLLPAIRKIMSGDKPMIVRFSDHHDVLKLVNSERAKEVIQVGPATPDHVLRTKPWPMFVDVDGSLDDKIIIDAMTRVADNYVKHYTKYYEEYNQH